MGIDRSTLVVVTSDNGPEASFETDSAGEKLVGWLDGWTSVSNMDMWIVVGTAVLVHKSDYILQWWVRPMALEEASERSMKEVYIDSLIPVNFTTHRRLILLQA